jgi:hypothetical protein
MKYLQKFNEASKNILEYKFRTEVLPKEIEEILSTLNIELIDFVVSYRYQNTIIEIELQTLDPRVNTQNEIGRINKENIKDVLAHLVSYMNSENFKIIYLNTHGFGNQYDTQGYISQSKLAKNPIQEVSFSEIYEMLPQTFEELRIEFKLDTTD